MLMIILIFSYFPLIYNIYIYIDSCIQSFIQNNSVGLALNAILAAGNLACAHPCLRRSGPPLKCVLVWRAKVIARVPAT